MTKLEELRVTRDAAKASWHAADEARDDAYTSGVSGADWDAAYAAYYTAFDAYDAAEAELKKAQEGLLEDDGMEDFWAQEGKLAGSMGF